MHSKIVKAWIAASILSLVFSGCSQISTISQAISTGQSAKPAIKPLADIKASINPKLIWKQQIGSNKPSSYKVQLRIVGEALYNANTDTLSALNKKTGKLVWKENIGETITGGIKSDKNNVFIGTEQGSALALDPSTGETRWIALLNSPIISISNSKNNHIAFRTLDGKIHLLSTKNGDIAWQRSHKTPSLSLQGASSPILVGPLVIAGLDDGIIYAYNAETAQKSWSVKLGNKSNRTELSRLVDIDAEMKVIGTALFAVGYHGRIAGIDMRNGNIGWSTAMSSHSGIDADEKNLFVSDEKGSIWKLAPLTGVSAWENSDLTDRNPTAPTILNNTLITVGDKQGFIHWINSTSGKVVGRAQASKVAIKLSPIVDGNVIYTLSSNGLISAYSY